MKNAKKNQVRRGNLSIDFKLTILYITFLYFIIPISLQPDGVNPTYFKLSDFLNFDLTKFIV